MKSREEILQSSYLNKVEIARLLQIGPSQSFQVFNLAMRLDDQQLGEWKIYHNRVRLKSVMKVTGTDFNMLQKQIKMSTSSCGKSAQSSAGHERNL